MTTRGRRWYAIEYAYGRGVINQGSRADHIHAFDTKAERNAWVDKAERSGTQADPINATHPIVQRARRYAALGLEWPVPVMSGE